MTCGDPLGRALVAAGAGLARRAGDPAALAAELPFLGEYLAADALDQPLPAGPQHPLWRLAAAGITPLALDLLVAIGLVEEDSRFLALTGVGGERPAFGPMEGLFAVDGDSRQALLDLLAAGLVTCLDSGPPRPHWPLAVPSVLWDALSGRLPRAGSLVVVPKERLLALENYLAPAGMAEELGALPARLGPGALLTIRGPAGGGRTTLAGAAARAKGLGLLKVAPALAESPESWAQAGALAVLAGALPVVALDLAPGERRELAAPGLWAGPVAVVLGRSGAVAAAEPGTTVALDLPMPDRALRLGHWRAALPEAAPDMLDRLAAGHRMTGGAIRAAAAGGAVPGPSTLRHVLRARAAPRLETVAARLDRPGTPLLVEGEARRGFSQLFLRARSAEELAALTGESKGLRALFAGPSGTGKTLAARSLAERLGRDLWRVDLAGVVSKWIGETEKNLERAFSAVEEHDAVLLIDEGDALMARRTDVGSANDRYANLETSYLLQRIERFDGMLIVATNAFERIDGAFTRRMDMVIRFTQPGPEARAAILLQHLGTHGVSEAFLTDVAMRCALTGGQLRNVALAARIEAMAAERLPGDRELRLAVMQEYRKANLPCPLKSLESLAG